jgi:ABC-type antimicrobial peptide transport system permease subunit
MPFSKLLIRLLTKPQRHTLLSMVTVTILTVILVSTLPQPNGSIMTIAIQGMISAAISSVVLNELFLGLVDRKRDMAILLVMGVRKHLLGAILLGKTILYASVSCFLGVALGYVLMLYDGGSLTLTLNSSITLSSLAIFGPALLAGAYTTLYLSRLNVPKVLRH